MNANQLKVIEILKEERSRVEESWNQYKTSCNRVDSPTLSKKFFFQIVMEKMTSRNMAKANATDRNKFLNNLYNSIDKAEYACSKPGRDRKSRIMLEEHPHSSIISNL